MTNDNNAHDLAKAVSGFRCTNWRHDGPPPLIVNPQAATLAPKPRGPVCRNTFGKAVATPTEKRGFVMPELLGLVRLHRLHGFGHGGGHPQGRPHG